MKLRNILVCLLIGIFAIASATVIVTSNAHGVGRAVNADGHNASFTFDATKVTHNTELSVRGTFTFTVPGATSTDSTVVYLSPVQHMDFATNTAGFGGDGILRIQHGTSLHYYHGSVRVYATSNRHPGEAGDPDTIAVFFVPAVQTDPTFSFSGHVTDGDIAITTTNSY